MAGVIQFELDHGKLRSRYVHQPRKIVPVTNYVSRVEMAVMLQESVKRVLVPTVVNGKPHPRRKHSEDHRIMTIHVMREGVQYEYSEDMGHWQNYAAGQEGFAIPGMNVERVGDLMDYAAHRRNARPMRDVAGIELPALAQTAAAYYDQGDRRVKDSKHLSVFGPLSSVQRN
mgnify:CR=1 FL=1